MSTKSPRSRGVKSILLGSAFAVALGGVVVSEGVFLPSGPAHAQNITAQINQPLSFADVVERVQPAVVSIRVKTQSGNAARTGAGPMPNIPEDHPLYDFFRRFGEPGMPEQGRPRQREGMAQGSGFFISADGYVVTNNHVVENGTEVTVVNTDGEEFDAEIVGTDPKTDLALLKVTEGSDFPFVSFAPGEVRVGDWVVAVGNPFGLGGSVTAGIVSARGRDIGAGPYDDFLQIDAPINRGNSGGPTFDLEGNVVGVNTAIFSPSGGSVGIGFAIPARTAQQVIEDLRDDGQVVRGWLGVQIQPVTDDIADSLGLAEASGALVSQPQANSPAAKAGIEAGDVVLQVNGESVADARELARRIAAYPPETTVDVTVWRDGREETIQVELGQLPEDPQVAANAPATGAPSALEDYGLTLAPSSAGGGNSEGVVVTNVDPDGPAAEKGIAEGDVILEVAGTPVRQPRDVVAGLQQASEAGRRAVLLRVQSGDNVRFVALPVVTT